MKNKTRNIYLGVAAFVVGASVMAIEMTASRVLAPHFGASFFVWTALIVTVLLSMSIGYWLGGKVASKGAGNEQILGLLLSSSAALLLVSLWGSHSLESSTPVLFELLGGASSALFTGALFASFLFFSLPVFVLAMSGPVILKMWTQNGAEVGSAAGRYFAISTTGSVIGTLMPSLVLVPNLGVRITLVSVAVALAALGIPMLKGKFRLAASGIVVMTLLVVLSQDVNYGPHTVHAKESPYQLIRVEQHGTKRYLVFNEGSGTQSVYFPERERTGMYFDHVAGIPPLVPEGNELRTAVLGLAGGSIIRQYLQTFPEDITPDITGVEVDASVIDIAKRYFGVSDLPIGIVNEDGRTFLAARENQKYDVIFSDAYSTQMYIPSHMVSAEFFDLAKRRLKPEGVFSINVNAPERDSELLQNISNTIASVFPHVYVSKAGDTWNWLVTASRQDLDYEKAAASLPNGYSHVSAGLRTVEKVQYDPTVPVLTDDWAPIEFMTDKMVISDAIKQMSE